MKYRVSGTVNYCFEKFVEVKNEEELMLHMDDWEDNPFEFELNFNNFYDALDLNILEWEEISDKET